MIRFIPISLFCIVMALIGLSSCNNSEKAPAHASAIAPPFKNIRVPQQDFKIDASKEAIVHLPKGGSITVPANAFVDSDGNVLKGEVTLQYKQMNSAADIIASGIPMVAADENGQVQQMQSAGMFDIRGMAAGKEVFIAKDKSLQVNMASTVKGEYDLFYLEEEKPQTASVGFIPQALAAGNAPAPKTWWKKITKNIPETKDIPQALDSFKLKYNTKDFPENKALEQITWKLSDVSTNPKTAANAWVLQEPWNHISAVKTKYKSRLLNAFTENLSILPDSSGYYSWGGEGKSVKLYNIEGKLLKELVKGEIISRFEEQNAKQNYMIVKTEQGISIYDFKGTLLGQVKGIAYAEALTEETILYTKPNANNEKNTHLTLADIYGKVINDISIQPYNAYATQFFTEACYTFLKKNKVLLIDDQKGLSLYDLKGQLLAQASGLNAIHPHHYWNGLRQEQYFYCEDENEHCYVWDWKNNKQYFIKEASYIDDIHPEKTELIYAKKTPHQDKYSKYIYNWITSKEIKLDTYSDDDYTHYSNYYSPKGHFIRSHTYIIESINGLYNDDGQKISEGIKGYFQINDSEELCLSNAPKKHYLLDAKGNIIKNFSDQDSSLNSSWLGKNKVITFNNSGILSEFDLKGHLLTRYNLGLQGNPIIVNDTMIALTTTEKSVLLYDKKTKTINQAINGNIIGYPTIFKNNIVFIGRYGEWGDDKSSIWKLTKEATQVGEYQLCLSNKEKMFQTYVFLTGAELKQLEAFQNLKAQLEKKEAKRKEDEAAVLRSFQISKFGIYNWDVFYHNEKEVIAFALSLEADSLLDGHTDFTAFLVTGQDQNVVVKFRKEQLSGFKFWANEAAQLLVVLPNGQIGLLDQKVFADMDRERLKKEKKGSFKLKIYDAVESKKVLEELLSKQPV